MLDLIAFTLLAVGLILQAVVLLRVLRYIYGRPVEERLAAWVARLAKQLERDVWFAGIGRWWASRMRRKRTDIRLGALASTIGLADTVRITKRYHMPASVPGEVKTAFEDLFRRVDALEERFGQVEGAVQQLRDRVHRDAERLRRDVDSLLDARFYAQALAGLALQALGGILALPAARAFAPIMTAVLAIGRLLHGGAVHDV